MKDIKGFEGIYAITEDGRVYNLKHKRYLKNCGKNYQRVTLNKNGKGTSHYIHRLVAQAFLPNPDNLPEINHKDENTHNNNVWNLEWCTREYNINYGTRNARVATLRSREVYCVELDRTFKHVRAASEELGLCSQSVYKVCRGTFKTAGKLHFRFVEKVQKTV